MLRDRLVAFLNVAREYPDLLIDLCMEPDMLSRAQVLALLERYGAPMHDKERLIKKLIEVDILTEEPHGAFSVNPLVVKLVNYYERRGALMSATFLRDQMTAIVESCIRLRRELAAVDADRVAVFDAIDNLYRLVREVVTIGNEHYVACMRLLGDIKRTGDEQTLEQRIDRLAAAQRRHIEPLRDLTDPNGEYQPRLAEVRALVEALEQRADALPQSQELERIVRRLRSDLLAIDNRLLRRFAETADAARALLDSLLTEKSLKEALAFCLARLDQVWPALTGQTLIASGRRVFAAPAPQTLEAFFADVVQRKRLPRPRSLAIVEPQRANIEEQVITERHVWRAIADMRVIESWPAFVVQRFAQFDLDQWLFALTLPLMRAHPHVRLEMHATPFQCVIGEYTLRLRDFGVFWEERHEGATAAVQRGDLSTVDARVSV